MCHWCLYTETHSSFLFIEMKQGIVYPHFWNLPSCIVPVRIFKRMRMAWHRMAWAMHFVPFWGRLHTEWPFLQGWLKQCEVCERNVYWHMAELDYHLDVTRTKVLCWGALACAAIYMGCRQSPVPTFNCYDMINQTDRNMHYFVYCSKTPKGYMGFNPPQHRTLVLVTSRW